MYYLSPEKKTPLQADRWDYIIKIRTCSNLVKDYLTILLLARKYIFPTESVRKSLSRSASMQTMKSRMEHDLNIEFPERSIEKEIVELTERRHSISSELF